MTRATIAILAVLLSASPAAAQFPIPTPGLFDWLLGGGPKPVIDNSSIAQSTIIADHAIEAAHRLSNLDQYRTPPLVAPPEYLPLTIDEIVRAVGVPPGAALLLSSHVQVINDSARIVMRAQHRLETAAELAESLTEAVGALEHVTTVPGTRGLNALLDEIAAGTMLGQRQGQVHAALIGSLVELANARESRDLAMQMQALRDRVMLAQPIVYADSGVQGWK